MHMMRSGLLFVGCWLLAVCCLLLAVFFSFARHSSASWNPACDLPPLPLAGEGWGEGGAPLLYYVIPAKAGIQRLCFCRSLSLSRRQKLPLSCGQRATFW